MNETYLGTKICNGMARTRTPPSLTGAFRTDPGEAATTVMAASELAEIGADARDERAERETKVAPESVDGQDRWEDAEANARALRHRPALHPVWRHTGQRASAGCLWAWVSERAGHLGRRFPARPSPAHGECEPGAPDHGALGRVWLWAYFSPGPSLDEVVSTGRNTNGVSVVRPGAALRSAGSRCCHRVLVLHSPRRRNGREGSQALGVRCQHS